MVPGAEESGVDREAVVPVDAAAEVEESVAAAVGEALGSSGCGGGGFGGGEDMVETRVPDTKLVGLGFLPGLRRRLYGQGGGGRGLERARRRVGAVAARV